MAFTKKQRIAEGDGRPQGTKLEQREKKVASLRSQNTPEARAALKKMNDKVYRGGRSNLSNWYSPKGKKASARGKQTRLA